MNQLAIPSKLPRGLTLFQKNRVAIDKEFHFASQLLIIEEFKKEYSVEWIIEFCETTYRKCKQFESTEKVVLLGLQIARFLEFNGDESQRRKIGKYLKESKVWKNYFDLEFELRHFTYDLNRLFSRKMSFKDKVSEIDKFLNTLDVDNIKTYNAQLNYFEILLKKYMIQNDKKNLSEICQTAIKALNKKRFTPSATAYAVFSIHQIPIYLEGRNFSKGLDLINQSYKYTPKGGNNWFSVHSYEVILEFMRLKLDRVSELIENNTNYPNSLVRERYELYRAYLSIFQEGSFKVNRFLNSTIQFSRDKRGYNIAIVIVKMLHLVKQRRHEEFIDLMERVDQYRRDWVRDKELSRSRIFLKILLTLPKSHFREAQFKLNTKRHLRELKKVDIKTSSIEVELIDYEFLYDKVVSFIL